MGRLPKVRLCTGMHLGLLTLMSRVELGQRSYWQAACFCGGRFGFFNKLRVYEKSFDEGNFPLHCGCRRYTLMQRKLSAGQRSNNRIAELNYLAMQLLPPYRLTENDEVSLDFSSLCGILVELSPGGFSARVKIGDRIIHTRPWLLRRKQSLKLRDSHIIGV